MKKSYEVSLMASATVCFTLEVQAESESEAREIFRRQRDATMWEGLDMHLVEPPQVGHDFQETDVDAGEVEPVDFDKLVQQTTSELELERAVEAVRNAQD